MLEMSVLFAGQHQGFCNPWMLAKSHMLPELYPSTGGWGWGCFVSMLPGRNSWFFFFSQPIILRWIQICKCLRLLRTPKKSCPDCSPLFLKGLGGGGDVLYVCVSYIKQWKENETTVSGKAIISRYFVNFTWVLAERKGIGLKSAYKSCLWGWRDLHPDSNIALIIFAVLSSLAVVRNVTSPDFGLCPKHSISLAPFPISYYSVKR